MVRWSPANEHKYMQTNSQRPSRREHAVQLVAPTETNHPVAYVCVCLHVCIDVHAFFRTRPVASTEKITTMRKVIDQWTVFSARFFHSRGPRDGENKTWMARRMALFLRPKPIELEATYFFSGFLRDPDWWHFARRTTLHFRYHQAVGPPDDHTIYYAACRSRCRRCIRTELNLNAIYLACEKKKANRLPINLAMPQSNRARAADGEWARDKKRRWTTRDGFKHKDGLLWRRGTQIAYTFFMGLYRFTNTAPARREAETWGQFNIFPYRKQKEKKESFKFGYTNIYINFYCHSLSCSFFAPLLSPAFHLHVRAMLSFRFGRGINVRGGMI